MMTDDEKAATEAASQIETSAAKPAASERTFPEHTFRLEFSWMTEAGFLMEVRTDRRANYWLAALQMAMDEAGLPSHRLGDLQTLKVQRLGRAGA